MDKGHEIVETKVTSSEVVLTLRSGVSIHLSSNLPNYIHLSFSGTEVPMEVGIANHLPEVPTLKVPNYVNIYYKIREGLC